ncbi:MAG: hypothetical protein R3E79_21050 [Caldilineaceae bacterium]
MSFIQKRPVNYLFFVLLATLFILAPLVFIITALLLRLYRYITGDNRSLGQLIRSCYDSDRLLILVACGLTLASLAIYQTEDYAVQFGFPTTFITYYTFPGITKSSHSWFGIITASVSIHLLQGALNVALYFWLLRIIRRLWHVATRTLFAF